jgi:hypothetical protein
MCEAWGIVDSFRSFCFAHIHFSFFYALGVLAGVWGRVILLVEKIGAGVFGGNSFFLFIMYGFVRGLLVGMNEDSFGICMAYITCRI